MAGPLSVEDMLAKQKAEKEAAAKVCSVFLQLSHNCC